eukprot:UN23488
MFGKLDNVLRGCELILEQIARSAAPTKTEYQPERETRYTYVPRLPIMKKTQSTYQHERLKGNTCWIRIRNLPRNTVTVGGLKNMFAKRGYNVDRVEISKNPAPYKKWAFLLFKSPQIASEAVEDFNNAGYGGETIATDWAKPDGRNLGFVSSKPVVKPKPKPNRVQSPKKKKVKKVQEYKKKHNPKSIESEEIFGHNFEAAKRILKNGIDTLWT